MTNISCGIEKQAFCNCCLNHFLSHDNQLIIRSGCISTATGYGSVVPTELTIPSIHLLPLFPSGVSGAHLVAGLHVILLNRDHPLSESDALAFKQTISPVLFSALDTIIRIVTLSLPSLFCAALCSSYLFCPAAPVILFPRVRCCAMLEFHLELFSVDREVISKFRGCRSKYILLLIIE